MTVYAYRGITSLSMTTNALLRRKHATPARIILPNAILQEHIMPTASEARGQTAVKPLARPVKYNKKNFLGQLTPKLRDTVEALQKLYRKK